MYIDVLKTVKAHAKYMAIVRSDCSSYTWVHLELPVKVCRLRERVVHVAPPAVMALLKKMKKDSDGCLEHAYVMQPITGERLLTWKTMQTSMKQVRLVLDNGLSGVFTNS